MGKWIKETNKFKKGQMKTYIINIIALLVIFNFAQAQEIRYVKAENGLILRDKPNRGSNRIAKLDYGTQLEILERTNLKLDVKDNNEIISGEWVKISATDTNYEASIGYVFNGFLTETALRKRFKISFDAFSISMDNLDAFIDKKELTTLKTDTINVAIELGETVQDKTIRIKHHVDYKSIKVFQKHENSITIMDEGPHCDLIDWKHYYSSWMPLESVLKNNQFKTVSYADKDWNKFIKTDINELKAAVKSHCGERWSDLIKNIKSVNEYPSGVSINSIYIKVILTTLDDVKIEKIITFNIPMGC